MQFNITEFVDSINQMADLYATEMEDPNLVGKMVKKISLIAESYYERFGNENNSLNKYLDYEWADNKFEKFVFNLQRNDVVNLENVFDDQYEADGDIDYMKDIVKNIDWSYLDKGEKAFMEDNCSELKEIRKQMMEQSYYMY